MPIKAFNNGQLCRGDQLLYEPLVFSTDNGCILDVSYYRLVEKGNHIDITGKVIAPGFLELQTNGVNGFHFSNYSDHATYKAGLKIVSSFLVTKGVTAFWATLPTVAEEMYHKILPSLTPIDFAGTASLLGAHIEGPFLAPEKKGAHAAELFRSPDSMDFEKLYGTQNLQSVVKLATIAPELRASDRLISALTNRYGIRVSLGHSSASYDQGLDALKLGASGLTHVFNAMNPIHHRQPGLAGLLPLSTNRPYYSLIPDGVHLHPATLSLAFRANPQRCMLITDSIELAGLEDGVYPGNSQIRHRQRKSGNKVVIEGTDTLIGSCLNIDQGLRNLIAWSGCTLAEAVRCATENIAGFMGVDDRGTLDAGRRADLAILDKDCNVEETWVGGEQAWAARGSRDVNNLAI